MPIEFAGDHGRLESWTVGRRLNSDSSYCTLENWRPVAVSCTDYKILAKCLSNILKPYLECMVNEYQMYCIPKQNNNGQSDSSKRHN